MVDIRCYETHHVRKGDFGGRCMNRWNAGSSGTHRRIQPRIAHRPSRARRETRRGCRGKSEHDVHVPDITAYLGVALEAPAAPAPRPVPHHVRSWDNRHVVTLVAVRIDVFEDAELNSACTGCCKNLSVGRRGSQLIVGSSECRTGTRLMTRNHRQSDRSGQGDRQRSDQDPAPNAEFLLSDPDGLPHRLQHLKSPALVAVAGMQCKCMSCHRAFIQVCHSGHGGVLVQVP